MTNLFMPSNPRYQPKALKEYFGYDNLARFMVEVELAVMKTLGSQEVGVIPASEIALLTPEVEKKLYQITTSEMDQVEREVTKHDVRALVRLMQERLPEPLRRWVHVPLTSYDVLDTARAVMFHRAHRDVVLPMLIKVVERLSEQVEGYAEVPQIGRTHGQYALPITVGFWLSGILHRVVANGDIATRNAIALKGKISGAVGAYNAQVALGIEGELVRDFEIRVLRRLNIGRARIASQVVPPEPLSYYLFSCLMLSGAFGQLGRDCRHLMRSEIAEVGEPFEKGQVGSSTMAHKRNPITFENLEGMWERSKAEFGKVLSLVITEHQRDLTGSSVARDLPAIVVNLTQQLSTLLREKDGVPFISRISIDRDRVNANLSDAGDQILAEPMYLLLQMHGYKGDAHEVVNHKAMPLVSSLGSLLEAMKQVAFIDPAVGEVWEQIPAETKILFEEPSKYVGLASKKCGDILRDARQFSETWKKSLEHVS